MLAIGLRMIEGLGEMISPNVDFIESMMAAISIAGAVMAIAGVVIMIPRLAQNLVSAGVPRMGL